jgi:hypothetical protein
MDHIARVIHELDEHGNVLRIGWEPAAAIDDQRKAVNAATRLIQRVAPVLAELHQWAQEDDVIKQFYESAAVTDLRDAITDIRPLTMALHRTYNHGASFPRWETAPQSKRFQPWRKSA